MLFMEGTPREPKSWNSKVVVNVLRNENVIFGSFDIQVDKEVCEGLKKFSMRPTFLDFIFIYERASIFNSGFDDVGDHQIEMVHDGMIRLDNWYPQLYCKRELLGGYKLVTRLHEEGVLQPVKHGRNTSGAAPAFDVAGRGDA